MSTLLTLLLLTANPDPTAEADQKAIKQLVTEFREAVSAGDTKRLLQTFMPGAVVFEHGSVDRTPEQFVNEHMAGHFKTMKLRWLDEENTGRSDGPMAYVAQRALLETTEKGKTTKAPHTFTFVFRKKDGAWKIAHLHWSIGKAELSAPASTTGADAGR